MKYLILFILPWALIFGCSEPKNGGRRMAKVPIVGKSHKQTNTINQPDVVSLATNEKRQSSVTAPPTVIIEGRGMLTGKPEACLMAKTTRPCSTIIISTTVEESAVKRLLGNQDGNV